MSLLKELKVFVSYPRNMRVLLLTNLVYASALPVIWAFVGVYIMRNTDNNIRLVICFPMANYLGSLATFILNGYLLRIIPVKYLYSLGMLISALSLLVMISLKELNFSGILMAGTFLGVATGLFWANHNYLALSTTTDETRNYYYGIENFFTTLCSVVVPITVGWIIAGSQLYGWFGGDRNHAYFFLALSALLLTCLASIILYQGTFTNPKATKFLYWDYDPLWNKILFMNGFRGLGQIFILAVPAMLTVKLIGGQEGILGIITTSGNILMALVFYGIARLSRPEHRAWILLTGLSFFTIGSLCNSILFNAVGGLIFIAFLVIASALMECSFFPVTMLVMDLLSKKENRSKYAYIMNNEFPLNAGRLLGTLLFVGASYYISDAFALRYVLLLVGIVQLFAYVLCKQILVDCHAMNTELTEYELRTEPHAMLDLVGAEKS